MTGEPAAPSSRSYIVVGTGAMGIYYGGLLHNAGIPVTFLSTRLHERPDGFIIESAAREIIISHPCIVARVDDAHPHDVAVITLKTTQNHLLPELLPRILKPDGSVVFLQNGIGVEAEALRVIAREQVLVGMCYVGVEKIASDRIRHVDGGRIVLGSVTGGNSDSPRVRDVAMELTRAGIPVQLTDDLRRAQWQKLLWNIPFNGLSVVLDRFPHEIAHEPAACAQVGSIMREVLAAAKATGHPLPDSLIQQLIDYTRTLPPFHTSMRMDFDRGREMELRTMYENPIRLARQHGVAMPATEWLLGQLRHRSRTENGS